MNILQHKIIIFFFIFTGVPAKAEIYKCISPDGTTKYTSIPCANGLTKKKGKWAGTQAKQSTRQNKKTDKETSPVLSATIVISQAYAIERLVNYCKTHHPQYSPLIKVAQDKWLIDHDFLYKKSGKIIKTKLSKKERTSLFVSFKVQNNKIIETLQDASEEKRKSWCKDAAGKINSPQMSLLKNKELVKSILEFE